MQVLHSLPMLGMRRYCQENVAPVRIADAREFLVTIGLPEQSSIFVAAGSAVLTASRVRANEQPRPTPYKSGRTKRLDRRR